MVETWVFACCMKAQWVPLLFQEAVDDLFFCFLLGKAEGHEFDKLFAGDFADGGFVDEHGVFAGGFDAGDGLHFGVAHDDGVALHVAAALRRSDDERVEHLDGVILRHGARDHLHAGVLAVQLDLHVRRGGLLVVGEQLLGEHELGAGGQLGVRVAHGGGDAAQLHHLHLARRAFLLVHVGSGVQDALAGALAFAVVLLHVLDVAVLAQVEAVDAVVLGGLVARIVDAAARHDGDVAVLADVERVVHDVLQPRLRDDDRDVHGLAAGAGGDADVDAGVVGLGGYLDVRRGMALDELAVAADVERTLGHAVDVGDLGEEVLVDGGKVDSHE